jgi:hypothetical protein
MHAGNAALQLGGGGQRAAAPGERGGRRLGQARQRRCQVGGLEVAGGIQQGRGLWDGVRARGCVQA